MSTKRSTANATSATTPASIPDKNNKQHQHNMQTKRISISGQRMENSNSHSDDKQRDPVVPLSIGTPRKSKII